MGSNSSQPHHFGHSSADILMVTNVCSHVTTASDGMSYEGPGLGLKETRTNRCIVLKVETLSDQPSVFDHSMVVATGSP